MHSKKNLLIFVLVFMGLWLSCAGTRKPTQTDWVEQQLRRMSLEEKLGQMFVFTYYPRFYNEDNPTFQRIERLVRDYHIGAISIYKGNPYAVARYIQRLQNQARIPLMVMADMEWGVTMRVEEGTDFLTNMGIGATRSPEYAYQMGKIIGEEARAVGIHVNFAPVVDVNNNPDNLIINTRSYGEDPQFVAKMGAAFIKGLQEEGVYATAKHFPGHGDTNVDSHLGLPVIDVPAERLEKVELPPFKAAVDAGVKMIMVAHITYSAFPQMQGRPATLDPYFVQDVLRKQWGFKGLVITDAMGMGGIVNNYWSGEAAVLAIKAGADFLLDPPNFEPTFKFVLDAVREGRISERRIDESVRRILRAKYELGLWKRPQIDLKELERVMARRQHLQKAEEIANAAMTLLKDSLNVLPFHAQELDTVMVVTVTDRDWGYRYRDMLAREVKKRVPVVETVLIQPGTCNETIQQAIARADSVDAVIMGIFVTWGSYKGSITLPDTTAKLLGTLLEVQKPMAVVAFGSPYLIRQLPRVPSYLCAYATSPLAVRAATRAIFGEIPIRGKIPVSIPGFFNMWDGLERPAYPMELEVAEDDQTFAPVYQLVEQAIADSVFPGAQIAIVHDGKLVALKGFGHHTYDPNSPKVTTRTIYDMASVTKVVVTTTIAMQLWEKKQLRLDVPVKSYIPEFSGGLKDSVTVRHLLTHSGGLHWWVPLWEKVSTPDSVIPYICSLPLDYAPGDSFVYSDLGMMLMQEILERVTGKSLDQLAKSMVFQPLDMRNSMFNPPDSLKYRIAPTEIGGSMHRGLIHGEVHDENAFFRGGVSGHAGLFSNARDMANFAQMYLWGGVYKHHRLVWPQTIQYWTQRQNIPPGSDRALGWDTPSMEGYSSAGHYFSAHSFGHTGFTGTSIWIDPDNNVAAILLTNRVHPTRKNRKIIQFRPKFYDAVMEAIARKTGKPLIPRVPVETPEHSTGH